MKEAAPAYPLGLFVGGFRWSGSGAVCDWLADFQGVKRPDGSEASFGEIRAINYGLRYLLLTSAGAIRWGEGLGRWALCPEPRSWGRVLGAPLTRERERAAFLYALADAAYTLGARPFIMPGLGSYRQLLKAQLGTDFLEDETYLSIVRELTASLRAHARRQTGEEATPPWEDGAVRDAAIRLVGLFHERIRGGEGTVLFENAFSGMSPELIQSVHPGLFEKTVFILVHRDPRDQFVDLVRSNKATFPWSVRGFIAQYRKARQGLKAFLESSAGFAGLFVREIGFEDFVQDEGARMKLGDELSAFWGKDGPRAPVAGAASYEPEASVRNIGIWRSSRMRGEIRRVARELQEYLWKNEST